MSIRLRHMLRLSPSASEIEAVGLDDLVTFAPMDAIRDGLGGLDVGTTIPLRDVRSGSYNYFREGDALLAKVTPCFENGKKALATNLVNGIGFATSEVHVLRPDPTKLDARFLIYLLSSEDFRASGMQSMTGAGGLKRVSESAILNYRPCVTDLQLQKKIANYLDHATARIDDVIERVCGNNAIRTILPGTFFALLIEKRAALITAAVTGQIDVDTYGRAGATSATLDRIEKELQE